jgi:hypothetical protein
VVTPRRQLHHFGEHFRRQFHYEAA